VMTKGHQSGIDLQSIVVTDDEYPVQKVATVIALGNHRRNSGSSVRGSGVAISNENGGAVKCDGVGLGINPRKALGEHGNRIRRLRLGSWVGNGRAASDFLG